MGAGLLHREAGGAVRACNAQAQLGQVLLELGSQHLAHGRGRRQPARLRAADDAGSQDLLFPCVQGVDAALRVGQGQGDVFMLGVCVFGCKRLAQGLVQPRQTAPQERRR